MPENGSEEGLLVRAEPLALAEAVSRRMVEVRVVDGALLLDAEPTWAGAINTVLGNKGVRVKRLRRAGLEDACSPTATEREEAIPKMER